ncbi:hypothetical protein BLX24_14995 [Arsenicibacter rosenii]|uniref:Uncharacterized protein n=1 Tax=Arsenicibacter rosenii TaxID=1750698 RepID=A0A1S2VHT2_9BACT|nr:hypothetical protein BLX24_14995 [Arsenicibacter rosenii]
MHVYSGDPCGRPVKLFIGAYARIYVSGIHPQSLNPYGRPHVVAHCLMMAHFLKLVPTLGMGDHVGSPVRVWVDAHCLKLVPTLGMGDHVVARTGLGDAHCL